MQLMMKGYINWDLKVGCEQQLRAVGKSNPEDNMENVIETDSAVS